FAEAHYASMTDKIVEPIKIWYAASILAYLPSGCPTSPAFGGIHFLEPDLNEGARRRTLRKRRRERVYADSHRHSPITVVAEEFRSRLGTTEVLFFAQQPLMNEVEGWRYENWHLQAERCGKVLSLH